MRINHNIPALRTLHQMNKTNSKIDKTMQKLSSGLRINSAADDAAGLAIAQKMDTQVRGLQQANRNSMDGISLIQTAEGALNEVHDMLQRTRELSIQASNGTLTASDRKAITDEVEQLKAEINRISEHIEYNERKLLNGEIDRRKFSNKDTAGKVISMSDTVDAGDYTINISSPATQTTLVGSLPTETIYDPITKKVVKGGTININNEQVEIKVGDTEQDVFARIRNLADTIGLDVAVKGGETYKDGSGLIIIHREYGEKDIKVQGDVNLLKGLGLHTIVDLDSVTEIIRTGREPTTDEKGLIYDLDNKMKVAGEIMINNKTVNIVVGDKIADIITKITNADLSLGITIESTNDKIVITNNNAGASGVAINFTGNSVLLAGLGLDTLVRIPSQGSIDRGKDAIIAPIGMEGFPEGQTHKVKGNIVTFEANNSFKLTIEAGKTKRDFATGGFIADFGVDSNKLVGEVTFSLLETGPLDLQIGANEGQMMQLRIQNMSTTALGLDDMNLNTADKSQEAITLVDNAIAQVSSARSKLGAYQNRLEHTVANLDVAAENMTASKSRIQDADMAKEMSEYTKDNILAQAGNAMLAQANQRPQQILQLLQ